MVAFPQREEEKTKGDKMENQTVTGYRVQNNNGRWYVDCSAPSEYAVWPQEEAEGVYVEHTDADDETVLVVETGAYDTMYAHLTPEEENDTIARIYAGMVG